MHWLIMIFLCKYRNQFVNLSLLPSLYTFCVKRYNGHGSGMEYLTGERIEKLNVKAIVLLFGCNSIKLIPIGGRFPPYGISNQYLIASR